MGSLEISGFRAIAVALVLFASHAPSAWATPEDDDFAARCAAPGVTVCLGFDTMGANYLTNDLTRVSDDPVNGNIHPRGDGQYRDSIDTVTKMSRAGSLKFTLDAGYANPKSSSEFYCCGGSIRPLPGRGLNGSFGPSSTFYVQFAFRISPEMKSNLNYWNSFWKVVVIFGGTPCNSGKSIVQVVYESNPNAYQLYKNCGAEEMRTALDGATWKSVAQGLPFTEQQGAYLCEYKNFTNCWNFPTNTWVTMYFKIVQNASAGVSPGSTIESWYSINRQPYVKWINVINNYTVNCNSGSPPCPSEAFDNIYISPFMTGLSVPAPSTAFIWYDELIVSTQPIAAPGVGGVALAAPSSLIVK